MLGAAGERRWARWRLAWRRTGGVIAAGANEGGYGCVDAEIALGGVRRLLHSARGGGIDDKIR